MKNLLSIIAFAFVMILSTQSVSSQSLSQDQNKPEVVAKAQVAELTNQLGLTGDQSRTLYRAFVAKEVNYRKQVLGQDAKSTDVISNKKKIDQTFMASMKKTLTEKQFSVWKESLNQ